VEELLTRRRFLTNLLAGIKIAAFSVLFPNAFSGCARASRTTEPAGAEALSLREIARRGVHHGNGKFLNPFSKTDNGGPWSLVKWKLFSTNRFKDQYARERVLPVSPDWKAIEAHRGLSVTFLKHSCIDIKDLDDHILVDPIFGSVTRFTKDFTPLAFDAREMPVPKHVLVTHGHYDHLDVPSLSSLRKETHVITPLGYDDVFEGLEMNRRTRLDWFGTHRENGREITLLPCNHWTMRNPLVGPNRSLWGSYLIKSAAGPTIYVSGDTAYFRGFREIGEEFDIDLAIVNLGAYEPRWMMAAHHMNPAEAVKAFKELRAKRLMVVHWGTFRLGDEPVYLPPIELRRELEKEGLLARYVLLEHGKTLFLEQSDAVDEKETAPSANGAGKEKG
jgi:L-ascorbate metabolism protein UlaG (beta-lactamase superfamily)